MKKLTGGHGGVYTIALKACLPTYYLCKTTEWLWNDTGPVSSEVLSLHKVLEFYNNL